MPLTNMPLTPRQRAIQELLAAIDRIESMLAAEKLHLADLEAAQEAR
jgi:hypothetical protein